MTHPSYPFVSMSFRHVIEVGYASLIRGLKHFGLDRRLMRRQGVQPYLHHQQQHFGMLDDQLLDDLGLQRSEIRAAEYGILPGIQALHHADAALSPGASAQTDRSGLLAKIDSEPKR